MKIAILGTENTHAYEFAKLIKNNDYYKDVELVGVYSYDEKANDNIINEGLCDCVAKDPHEMLDKVDAVMVTARHGDLHHEYVLPYLKAGIPCFIDKPLSVELSKAQDIIDVAKANGTLICGGSCIKHLDELKPLRRFFLENKIKSGAVSAPVDVSNEYGGFFFYSQHLVELLTTVFGFGVRSVIARTGSIDERKVSVIFNYGDFDVAGMYSGSINYNVTLAADGGKGAQFNCNNDVVYTYEYELREFIDMVNSGVMPHTYDELIYPVKLLHAIYKSYTEKKEIEL
ncbi:MAG: Gfo/Idh/MocA family oxidoreductase [Clostridia bacterium]|nr:Gfo/Idh/MocA family oxidoreductase [Clostridia bacterium]